MELIHLFISFLFLIGSVRPLKSSKKGETSEQKLDEVLTQEFKARDANHDGILTSSEIRQYYEAHPEKMSKEGLEFIEKNFKNVNADLEKYKNEVKRWLAENNTAARILNGVFGSNSTKHSHSKSKHTNETVLPVTNE